MKNLKAMNLQMYADPAPAPSPTPAPNPTPTPAPVEIDYDKLAQLISGKQAATEDSLLKGYFRQQGLSQEEMEQAIAAFKQQKAANTPDVGALQTQMTQAQVAAQQAQVQAAATLEAVALGIDAKSIPYILKLADFSQAVGQDGKINNETVNNAAEESAGGCTGFETADYCGSRLCSGWCSKWKCRSRTAPADNTDTAGSSDKALEPF